MKRIIVIAGLILAVCLFQFALTGAVCATEKADMLIASAEDKGADTDEATASEEGEEAVEGETEAEPPIDEELPADEELPPLDDDEGEKAE